MIFLELTLAFVAIVFIIALTVGQLRLIYRRYLKSYKEEIGSYLNSRGLTLDVAYTPTDYDWKNSPFEKPPLFRISFAIVTINGTLVTWTDTKYLVINTTQNRNIWLEIETTYFCKPKLTFKSRGKERVRKWEKLQSANVIVVNDNCPACGQHLSANDMECPDCGLNYR